MLQQETRVRHFGDVEHATDSGVDFGYTNEILDDVRSEFASLFGADFDMTSQTAAGRIIEAGTRTLVDCVGTVALNVGQLNLDYATGKYLDTLANLNDVYRHEKTMSSVICRFKGIPGTVIMGGFELVDGKFRSLLTTSAITLSSSGVAEVNAVYVEDVYEDIADAIEKILPRKWVNGLESVTATSSVVIGHPEESDDSLRRRLKDMRRTHDNFCIEITNQVSALEGVLSCFTYENGNHYNVFVDASKNVLQTYEANTIQVSAHSMICILDFDTEIVGNDGAHRVSEEELCYKIADIIYRTRSAGCAMTPLYRSSALDPIDAKDHIPVDPTKAASNVIRRTIDGYGYEMVFNKAEVVEYGILIKVRKNTYVNTPKALCDDILSALVKWQSGNVEKVDRQTVGRNVYAYEIAAAVSNVIPEIQITEAKVGTGAWNVQSPWNQTSLGMKISQRAHCTITGQNPNVKIYIDGVLSN